MIEAPLVVSMTDNGKEIKTRDVKVSEILNSIKTGKWRHEIEHIRATYQKADESGQDPKKAVRDLKVALPTIMWSGRFSTRSRDVTVKDKLKAHSGILCADIDADDIHGTIECVRDTFAKSPYVFALFASPTGTGIKVLIRVSNNHENHLSSFKAVERYVMDLSGCKIDPVCKDVTRPCFVSFDQNLFVREWDSVSELECTHKEHREHKEYSTQKTHRNIRYGWCVVGSIAEAVELATPQKTGDNHAKLYKLAGALLAYEQTCGVKVDHSELRGILKMWCAKAKPFLDPSQTEEDYYIEFLDAMENIKNPLGKSIADTAWEKAQANPCPPEAAACEIQKPEFRLLISLCRELQLLNGNEPFFLSPYTVKKFFGQNVHTTAVKWLGALKKLGIITLVEKGEAMKKATSYHFNFLHQNEITTN